MNELPVNEPKRIVIVDDHLLFRKGLSSLIDLFPNYTVLFDASNGKDLIAKLNPEHLPDIALIDIAMPAMDGYDTAAWLRENYHDIKVLALSTMDAETAIIRMIKCGARGYLLKDADPKDLKTAFDEVLSVGFYFNEAVTRKVMSSITRLGDRNSDVQILTNLTDREIEFLKLACTEKTYKEIAGDLSLSERTVDGYRESLFGKLKVSSRVGLVLFAIKNKIVIVNS